LNSNVGGLNPPNSNPSGPTAKIDSSTGWDLEFDIDSAVIETAILTKSPQQRQTLVNKPKDDNSNIGISKPIPPRIPQKSALKSGSKSSDGMVDNSFMPVVSKDLPVKKTKIVFEPAVEVEDSLVHKTKEQAHNTNAIKPFLDHGRIAENQKDMNLVFADISHNQTQVLDQNYGWGFQDDPTIFQEFNDTHLDKAVAGAHKSPEATKITSPKSHVATANNISPTTKTSPASSPNAKAVSPKNKSKSNSPVTKASETFANEKVGESRMPFAKSDFQYQVHEKVSTLDSKMIDGWDIDSLELDSIQNTSAYLQGYGDGRNNGSGAVPEIGNPNGTIIGHPHSPTLISPVAKLPSPKHHPPSSPMRSSSPKIDSRNHPNSVLTSVVNESVELPSYAMTENRLVEDSEIPLGHAEGQEYWNEEEFRKYTQEELDIWNSEQNYGQNQYAQAEIDAWDGGQSDEVAGQQIDYSSGVELDPRYVAPHRFSTDEYPYPPENQEGGDPLDATHGLGWADNGYSTQVEGFKEPNYADSQVDQNDASKMQHGHAAPQKWDDQTRKYDEFGTAVAPSEWDQNAKSIDQQYDEFGHVVASQEWDQSVTDKQEQYDEYGNGNGTAELQWDQTNQNEQQYYENGNYFVPPESDQAFEYVGQHYDENANYEPPEWDQNATSIDQQYDEFGNVVASQDWDQSGTDKQEQYDEYGNVNGTAELQWDQTNQNEQQYYEYENDAAPLEWDQAVEPVEQQYDLNGNYAAPEQWDQAGFVASQQWQAGEEYANSNVDQNAGLTKGQDWQQNRNFEEYETVLDPLCTKCAKLNVEEANFCVKCGNPLAKEIQSPYISNYPEVQSNAPEAAYIPDVLPLSDYKDPLQRDKGHCIAIFGFGGRLITMCPKRQTLYQSDGRGGQIAKEKIYPGLVGIKRVEKCLYTSPSQERASKNPVFVKTKPTKGKLKAELDDLRKNAGSDESLLLIDYVEFIVDNDCSISS
jgi:Vesicle coat trafficking protein Sec16 mid-region